MKKIMGKGTMYLTVAGVFVLALNYFLHIFLARSLGPELYGVFGILMSLYMINGTFLSSGIYKAVSRFVADSKTNLNSVIKSSFKLQLIISIIFTLFYIVFARSIAILLGDTSLTYYIVFVGLTIIPFTLLSLYWNGYLNGLRMFKKQAFMSFSHALLKAVFTVFFITIGFKIYGVLGGYLLAIIISLLMGRSFLKSAHRRINRGGREISIKQFFNFALPIIISSLFLSLIRNINVLFVKSFLSENILAGFYTAAVTLSNIPLMIFTSLFFTLMPSISNAIARNNMLLIKRYISQSLRYLIMLVFPIATIVAGTATNLILLIYPKEFSPAGSVLSLLIFSSTFLITFSILSAIIVGSGSPKVELLIGFLSLILLVTISFSVIPTFGIVGAAFSSLISSFFAMILAGIYVYNRFGCLISLKSFLNITFASVILYIVTLFWQSTGFFLVIEYLFLFLLYVTILLIFNEIKKEDVYFVKRIFNISMH
jgi:stage V sporulation protein B